jgi:hypothetical protein
VATTRGGTIGLGVVDQLPQGQWMLAIVSVAAVLAGPPAWAQNPPAPTEPAPESDRPLGDDEAMVLNFERPTFVK